MARKKNAKTAKAKKTTTQRQTKGTTGTALEKSFHETPTKLITQAKKELATLTSQEKKLKAEVKRTQAQKKTLKKQHTTATAKHKKSASATTKKQLGTVKQNSDKNAKTLTTLTTQLANLKTEIKALSGHHSKYVALNKHLAAFEKQWKQKTKAAAAPKAKTRKKTAKKTQATQETGTQTNTHQDTQLDNTEHYQHRATNDADSGE